MVDVSIIGYSCLQLESASYEILFMQLLALQLFYCHYFLQLKCALSKVKCSMISVQGVLPLASTSLIRNPDFAQLYVDKAVNVLKDK